MPKQDVEHKQLIILIEDEQILSELLKRKLEKAGYHVEAAGDGDAGLQLVDDLKPDLVLLDMMLPKMNGFSVLEQMTERKLLPGLPVIIISNSGQDIELERALKMGVRDYLVKVNFDPDEVLERVRRILRPAKESAVVPEPVAPPPAPRATVLIIEDDMFLLELLEKKFVQEGYRVMRAMDAEQARRVLAGEKVAVILLDIVLPGIDGFTFLAELKSDEAHKAIPVIIISNLGQKEEVERGLGAGAADYTIKAHTTPKEIVEKVERVLHKVKH